MSTAEFKTELSRLLPGVEIVNHSHITVDVIIKMAEYSGESLSVVCDVLHTYAENNIKLNEAKTIKRVEDAGAVEVPVQEGKIQLAGYCQREQI